MLVLTGGQERTEAEYRRLLEVAGFELEQLIAVDADTFILTAMPCGSREAGYNTAIIHEIYPVA